MRPQAIVAGLAGVTCLAALASPAAAADPVRYFEPGATFTVRALKTPLPSEQLGAASVAALARAGDASVSIPDVRGDEASVQLPADWTSGTLGPGGAVVPLPIASKPRKGKCRCKTTIGDDAVERVGAVFATRAFRIGDELSRLSLLELKLRYRDGVVIYINGREVARRNVTPPHTLLSTARRPHGPEWETIRIPVTRGLLVAGDNMLALEVRPSGHRYAPFLDAELSGRSGARIVRGPIVQRVGADSAVILFDTDLPTRASVEYGATAAMGQRAKSAGGSLAVRHRVALSGLPANAAVHYRVASAGDVRGDFVFHTAPAKGEPLRFVVYGDMRGGHRTHGKITRAVLREAPAFTIVTGDLVLRGTDAADWQRFFGVASDLLATVPYYPVAGNHDTGKSGSERRRMNELFELWPGPANRPAWGHWYSFDVADLHFVMIDSNSYEHKMQLDWLEADLAAARRRGVRAIFAAVHDGPYSRGLHKGNRYAAAHYAPVLRKHKVTLLFSGHDHLYQRGRAGGINYIVSGGGGAPLYPVRCGVPGKPRCKVDDGAKAAISAHHYVLVKVYKNYAMACPKRPDRSALEPCTKFRFRK